MAVSTATIRTQTTGNGSTTAFTFSFPVGSASELKVYEGDTLKAVTTDYTIAATNNDFSGGGTVTFLAAPASGVLVSLVRVSTLTSSLSLTTGDSLSASTLQSAFDDLIMLTQENKDQLNRSLHTALSNDDDLSMTLPGVTARQNSYLTFDADGSPTTTATVTGIELSTGDEGWTNVLQTAEEKKWVTLAVSGANQTLLNNDTYNKVSLILVTTGGSNRTIVMPPETATGVSNVGRRIAVVKMDAGSGEVILQNDAAGSIGTNIVNRYDVTQLVCLSATEWTSITENPVVNLLVPDAGTIGSATDIDAIAIGADGDVTLTQDLELQHDGAILSFGTNDDVKVTHVHDTGLTVKNEHTTGNSGIGAVVTLQTGDENVEVGDRLGEIRFQAPDEASGDADQNLVAASIAARSEGDFSDTNNATELVFKTGASETAVIGASDGDMTLSSGGNLTVGGILKTDDATEATSTTDGSLQTDGGLSVAKDVITGNDVKLKSDSSVLAFGTDSEVTFTHTDNVGLTLSHNLSMADGKGIDFSALSTPADAAGMSSEVLDDYEEGIWTPAYDSTGSMGTSIAYSAQNGTYVKIGRVVHIWWDLTTSGRDASGQSGYLQLTGLPFEVSDAVSQTADEAGGVVGRANGWPSDPCVVVQFDRGTQLAFCAGDHANGMCDPSDVDGSCGFAGHGTYLTN